MGKGTVIDNNGDGTYTVKVDFDTSRATFSINANDAKIINIEASIDAINALIISLLVKIGLETNPEELRRLWRDVDAEKLRISELELQITAIKLDNVRLQEIIDRELIVNARSIDGTLTFSGEVELMVVGSELINDIFISDGYDPVLHGHFKDTGICTASEAFYNLAMLPGNQKWHPQYRKGVITEIDYDLDTASVTLFNLQSSRLSLAINAETNITSVPISYSTCNSAAFIIGDGVIVSFGGDYKDPTVIGFHEDPVGKCNADRVLIETQDIITRVLKPITNSSNPQETPMLTFIIGLDLSKSVMMHYALDPATNLATSTYSLATKPDVNTPVVTWGWDFPTTNTVMPAFLSYDYHTGEYVLDGGIMGANDDNTSLYYFVPNIDGIFDASINYLYDPLHPLNWG